MDFATEFQSAKEEVGGTFEVVPEGDYVALVDNVTIDMTKKPARVSLIYTIVGGDQDKRKLFSNYNLEGRGLGFLKKDMKQLGCDYSNIKRPEDLVTSIKTAIGRACEVAVKHREYNNKTYASVWLNGTTTVPDVHGVPF